MADPTTVSQVLPAPILEGALEHAFTKKLEPLIGQQINTAAYAPQSQQSHNFNKMRGQRLVD